MGNQVRQAKKKYTDAFVRRMYNRMYQKDLEEMMSRVAYRKGGESEYQCAKQNAEYLARHEAMTDVSDILDLEFEKVKKIVMNPPKPKGEGKFE